MSLRPRSPARRLAARCRGIDNLYLVGRHWWSNRIYLWVGTSPGTDNLVGIGPLSGTSATVNLPTNGAPIYVQVQTAFSNGTAVFSGSYMYTEDNVTAAAITSPTPGGALPGASTTFTGQPHWSSNRYYLGWVLAALTTWWASVR